MEESEHLYRNWIVVAVGTRYWIGEELVDGSEAETGSGVPFNFSRMGQAFELLVLRAQKQTPDNMSIVMMQNNAWTTHPLCMGGVVKEVMWTERTYIRELNPIDRSGYVSFIEMAQKDFEKNRAAASGLDIASPADLNRLNRPRA